MAVVKVSKSAERLIQEVKDCGQDLISRAEEFVGTGDVPTDFSISLDFSVSGEEVPIITVTHRYYPKTTIDRYLGYVEGEKV